MDENHVAYALSAIGLVALIAATAASYAVSQQTGQLLAKTVPALLCTTDEAGQFELAAPTSPQGCIQILDMRAGDVLSACDSMPLAKRVACKQLVQLGVDRASDCSLFATKGTTGFSAGAPQAVEWCNAIVTE
jgi:hypothetical protein